MDRRTAFLFGSISGLIAVLLGAFGAHGLREQLIATQRLDVYNLAVEYQFYHTLALLLTAVEAGIRHSRELRRAAAAFAAGLVLFSGSLYVLAIFDFSRAGMVTPVGGLSFAAGWIFLFLHVAKRKVPEIRNPNDS